MKEEKGSITVFLSLVLVLLFSFILTTLESARITGATAYLSMLSQLSADSLFAHYYVPLFEEYGLFGIDAGYETTYFSEEKVEHQLLDYVAFGLEEMQGGLLSFEESSVSLTEYETMLSEEGNGFLEQVKEQVVLEGAKIGISELFDMEAFMDVAMIGELYQKQEETLQETNRITQEILHLMQLVDGICMSEQGFDLDKEGRLQVKNTFIKQLVCMNDEELLKQYKNEEIFNVVRQNLFSPKKKAIQIKQLMLEGISLKQQIFFYDEKIAKCKEELSILQQQLLADLEIEEREQLLQREQKIKEEKKELSKERDFLVEQLDLVTMDASDQYDNLKEKLNNIQVLLEKALKILDSLEQKQIIAQVVVKEYEQFLMSKKEQLSEELYEVFEKELVQMKLYVGLEEQGYYVPVMRSSLQKNQELLQQLSLFGFSYSNLGQVKREMEQIEKRIGEYTVKGLWFTYGEICIEQETGFSVVNTLEQLLTDGLFSFVGIEQEMISDRELTGNELPSQTRKPEKITKDLLECMEFFIEIIKEKKIQEILQQSTETALHSIALEIYFHKYFGHYMKENINSKLLYEREYLLFGKSKEKENLICMIFYLVAFRSLFTMVQIIKTPEKMIQLQKMATSVVGMTGIPVLISMTKYAILLLWSVEEALIEVCAILQGKKLSVIKGSGGVLSLEELVLFDSKLVNQKANHIETTESGLGYEEYLMLFSFTKNIKSKLYYAMDLIQENIRKNDRDSFRMRNVLTQVEFYTMTKLKKKYDISLFSEKAYELNSRQVYSY